MQLLRQELPRLRTCQERWATREQYPPGTISATLRLRDGLDRLPSTNCVEITNENANCTKCINVYF